MPLTSVILLIVIVSFSAFKPLPMHSFVGGNRLDLPMRLFDSEKNQLLQAPEMDDKIRFRNMLWMAAEGKRPLRVLHIGDSHVQADLFTGETRRLLAWWLSDSLAGRGMVFPYSVAGTTNPKDYSVVAQGDWKSLRVTKSIAIDTFGITGIYLRTYWPGSNLHFKMNGNGNSVQPFNRVALYFEGKGVAIRQANVLKQGAGYTLYQLPENSTEFEVFYTDSSNSSGFKLYGAELFHSQSKLIYHAVGVNGASSASFLQSVNFFEQLPLASPNIVLVSLGTNDAFSDAFRTETFENNLNQLIAGIKRELPGALVILTTPNDHFLKGAKPNQRIEMVRKSIMQITVNHECTVWDFYSLMGGEGSMAIWKQNGLAAPDMLHLSEKGYALKGQLLFKALIEFGQFSANEPFVQQIHINKWSELSK